MIKKENPFLPQPKEDILAAKRKEKLRINLKPEEKGIYSSLFDIACTKGKGKVERNQAVTFFNQTGLPTSVLQKIWEISCQTDRTSLTREEFYIALRLVALAQSGYEVSADAIILNIDAPIPKIESGVKMEFSVEEARQQITNTDFDKYLRAFNNADIEKKGYLNSEQMKSILEKTHLQTSVLSDLWSLADENGTGKFSKVSVICVLHLAVQILNGITLPREIPYDLKEEVENLLPDESAPGKVNNSEMISLLSKEIEERKIEFAELKAENLENNIKLNTLKEFNQGIIQEIKKITEELSIIKKAISDTKNINDNLHLNIIDKEITDAQKYNSNAFDYGDYGPPQSNIFGNAGISKLDNPYSN